MFFCDLAKMIMNGVLLLNELIVTVILIKNIYHLASLKFTYFRWQKVQQAGYASS